MNKSRDTKINEYYVKSLYIYTLKYYPQKRWNKCWFGDKYIMGGNDKGSYYKLDINTMRFGLKDRFTFRNWIITVTDTIADKLIEGIKDLFDTTLDIFHRINLWLQ